MRRLFGLWLSIIAVAAQAQTARRPTLVVFITVDQMRPDYFERFGAQLTRGLGRLYRGGPVTVVAYPDRQA